MFAISAIAHTRGAVVTAVVKSFSTCIENKLIRMNHNNLNLYLYIRIERNQNEMINKQTKKKKQ